MLAIRKLTTNLITSFSQKIVQVQPIRFTSASQPAEYISTNLENGLGRYVCQLQRVTFKFCKEHSSSRGIRWFNFDYVSI